MDLVTAGAATIFVEYRWSPDGRKIAYVDHHSCPAAPPCIDDLWVMQASGTGKIKVAEQASGISWSPDGKKIGYSRGQIHIINADGSGDVVLTNQPFRAFMPAWSPDGARIAFVTTLEELPDRTANRHIFLINPDGSGSVDLSQGRGDDTDPRWSPDGSKIAFIFAEQGNLGSEVAVMNRDGSGRTNLTNRPGFDIGPDWSPEGSRIVYQRSAGGDSEIYVMNPDGTAQTNVSNRPGTQESTPDWNGQGAAAAGSRQSAALEVERLHR
jgi:Tol biopolymer transport system component